MERPREEAARQKLSGSRTGLGGSQTYHQLLDLGLTSLYNLRKRVSVVKSPGLRYFVMASQQTDTDEIGNVVWARTRAAVAKTQQSE